MEGRQNDKPRPIKLLFTIVDRGKGKTVIETLNAVCESFHLSFMGHGTAGSDILDYLGLGETEKDLVLSVVREECMAETLAAVQREFKLDVPGNGIAFTIRITSVGGPATLQLISGTQGSLEEYAKRAEEQSRKRSEQK